MHQEIQCDFFRQNKLQVCNLNKKYKINSCHRSPNGVRIVLGTRDLNRKNNLIYKVKNIHKYDYNSATKTGDLSLMELEATPFQGRIDSNEHEMESVKLPAAEFDPSGRKCTGMII